MSMVGSVSGGVGELKQCKNTVYCNNLISIGTNFPDGWQNFIEDFLPEGWYRIQKAFND